MALNENYGPKNKTEINCDGGSQTGGVYVYKYICMCVYVWLSLCAWGMWREIVRAAGTQDIDEK